MAKNPKVGFYARTSTLNQTTGLEAQIRALEAYATANGITNYRIFKDEMSGRKCNRPGLDAMMAAIERGEVSMVVVYSLSRFSRSVKHLLESLELLNQKGVAFISLTEKLDTTTPTGRAVFTIIGAIAALEADLVRERVLNGLANAKAKGKRLGTPRRHADKEEVIHHLASQNVTQAEIARLTGVGQATVSRTLRKHYSKVGA